MIGYLAGATTAAVVGFLPVFEVYVAVPSGLAAGLDPVSAVVWASLGNAAVIPVVLLAWDQLVRIDRVRRWVERRAGDERQQARLDRWGTPFVLVMTPVLGVWAMTALARVAGLSTIRYVLTATASIVLAAVLTVALVSLGVDLTTA